MSRDLVRRAFIVSAIWGLPAIASATAPTDVRGLAQNIVDIINVAIPLVISLAVLYYLFGIAMSIKNSGSAKSWENLRVQIVWGILALFVMISIWGILRILDNTFITGSPIT